MQRFFLTALAAVVLTAGAGAQDLKAPGIHIGVAGVRLFGGDLALTYGDWTLTGGAGWETLSVGRGWASGAVIQPQSTSDKAPFNDWLFRNAGGEVRHSWLFPEAKVWVAAGALGYENFGLGPASAGQFPDQDGGLYAFGRAGVTKDDRTVNDHGVVTGVFAEAFGEYGPAWLAVRGTDYLKLSAQSSALVPLWDLPGPNHLFSGVLGFRADAQWIDGAKVPLPLLEPTEVRGYYRTLDTRLRSVATAELRVKGPSLWGPHDFVPVVFAFGEGGWYAGYADAPAADAGRTGWLAGIGLGLGLDVLGLTTPTLTFGLPLADGDSGLWMKINFNLRF
jgi:hypothetical protein